MIKFRAWDKQCKEMREVVAIDFYHDTYSWILDDYREMEQSWEIDDIEDVILMRYTGLNDTNGIEIFEGDIVKVTDGDESTDFSDGEIGKICGLGIGTICGLDELYMWYIDGQVHNGLFDISQQYYIEVIGNVHENPELMEVAE